jgi:hypothetical protein
VSWSGQDGTNGAGVTRNDVYVSDNNGPFQLWKVGINQTLALFSGAAGYKYAFYAIEGFH